MRLKLFVALSFIFLGDFIYCPTGGNDQGTELPSTPRTSPAQEPRQAFDPYQFSGHCRILYLWECAVVFFGWNDPMAQSREVRPPSPPARFAFQIRPLGRWKELLHPRPLSVGSRSQYTI